MGLIETKQSILKLIREAEEQFAGTGKALLDIEDYVAEYLTANGVIVPPCEEDEEALPGEWFVVEYEYLTCSLCGESYYTGAESTSEAFRKLKEGNFYPFCPHCGNPMDSVLNEKGGEANDLYKL